MGVGGGGGGGEGGGGGGGEGILGSERAKENGEACSPTTTTNHTPSRVPRKIEGCEQPMGRW